MRTGPEHGPQWRKGYETDGGTVTVIASHHPRRRMPNGHEMARQAMRGRPMEMVSEANYEWHMSMPGGRRALLRVHGNGRFHTNQIPMAFDTIEAAARAWGGMVAARKATPPSVGQDDSDEPDEAMPGPGGR